MFRVAVVGLGVQGPKRIRAAAEDVIGTVDKAKPAKFSDLRQVPLDSYDAALLCVPDEAKLPLLDYVTRHGKHALVEKPLVGLDNELERLDRQAQSTGAFIYIAYNHRFEPHFIRMREAIAAGTLGTIYRVRLFYGNGTARLVRDSAWRDKDAGVLPDLGSHLLDTIAFWFGNQSSDFRVVSARRFENRAADHVVLVADGVPQIELEMTLLSWRNHFVAEVFGELGQATISSLCKWGPSTFTLYRRVLPAGRPAEDVTTLTTPDPTWDAEYNYFRELCARKAKTDLSKDRWIGAQIRALSAEVVRRTV